MAIVRLYVDETLAYKNSFYVSVSIFGDPKNCEAYESDISQLVEANRKILGNDFKGFHANKLSDKNWDKLGPIYARIFNTLVKYHLDSRLGLHIFLQSKASYEANQEYLKNQIKKNLSSDDDNNHYKKLFASLSKEDLPALYQRIDKLFIYWLHRDKYGGEGDKFEYYPDSSGKILSYKDKEFSMSGTLPITLPVNFYDIVVIVANSYATTFHKTGWKKTVQQKMTKFEPLNDQESYLIQSCDIISNFLYNLLKYEVGLSDEKHRLKADVFKKYIDINNLSTLISGYFETDGNEVVCTNPKLKVNIP